VCAGLPSGCQLEWHFWGTGHGKGPHDGAGACLKQTIRKEQLKPDSVRLHGASDVVNFLKTAMNLPNAAYPGARRVVCRHFHLIGKTEVSRVKDMACNTIQGSRSMHSIRSVSHQNNVLLECRDFSCFCLACVARNSIEVCPRRSYATPWRLITLEPSSSKEVVQELEEVDPDWSKGPDENILASELETGDHFAILADPLDPNSNGAEFFVLLCTKPMYIVQEESLTDEWGVTVTRGDEVVEGLYYQRQGRRENSYVLLQDVGAACVYSHLVCANRFSMTRAQHKQKSGTSVYQLSDSALAHIHEAVRSSRECGELESEEEDQDLGDSDVNFGDDSDSCSNIDESFD
jgi:hypothetical protein